MKNAANNRSDKISHSQWTRGDEELASVITEFPVWRRGLGPGGHGDLFNCPEMKHGWTPEEAAVSVFSGLKFSIKTSGKSSKM